MLLDVVLRLGGASIIAVGVFLLMRLLVRRFVLPLLERVRPSWQTPVENSRLPTLTALLVAIITLDVVLIPFAQKYARLAAWLELLYSGFGLAVLTFLLICVPTI